MVTRKELITALSKRYKNAIRSDKSKILDEFIALTSYNLMLAWIFYGDLYFDKENSPK